MVNKNSVRMSATEYRGLYLMFLFPYKRKLFCYFNTCRCNDYKNIKKQIEKITFISGYPIFGRNSIVNYLIFKIIDVINSIFE